MLGLHLSLLIFSRKEKTMSIDQLELILYDMYHMDAWIPPLFGKWTEEFKKSSYSQWAVDELRDFIAERIYPRTSGSIDEFCELAHEFMVKMFAYSKVKKHERNCLHSLWLYCF